MVYKENPIKDGWFGGTHIYGNPHRWGLKDTKSKPNLKQPKGRMWLSAKKRIEQSKLGIEAAKVPDQQNKWILGIWVVFFA